MEPRSQSGRQTPLSWLLNHPPFPASCHQAVVEADVLLSAQLCPTLCDRMDRSAPGFPVLHYLPEFVQTHVHWVGDAIQPSHPLSSPSPPTFKLSQHQGLFPWVSSSHLVRWPKYWSFREMQIKTAMSYHLTSVRMAINKKSTNSKCWKDWRKGNPPILLVRM